MSTAAIAATDELPLSAIEVTSLLGSTGDVVVMIDHQSTVTWCSSSVFEMLGRDATSFVGTSAFDFIHPDHADEAADRFVRELTTPTPTYAPETYRLPLLHADGTWVEVDDRRPTDLRRRQSDRHDAVRPLHEQLPGRRTWPRSPARPSTRRLLASSRSTIAVVADDTTIIEVNDQVYELIGRWPDEVIGTSFVDVIDPRDLELAATLWTNALGLGNEGPGLREVAPRRRPPRVGRGDGRTVGVGSARGLRRVGRPT